MYQETLPQLKLEVAAILLNYSEINESEELKRELKQDSILVVESIAEVKFY